MVPAAPSRSTRPTQSRRSPSAPPTVHDPDRNFDADLEHAMMDITIGEDEILLEDDCEEGPEYLDLAGRKDSTGRKTKACPLSCTPREPINNTSQTQNDYLRDWLFQRDREIYIMLDREGIPEGLKCLRCGKKEIKWRCLDCIPRNKFCTECCHSSHLDHPFHHIFKWTGCYWTRSSAMELDIVVPVGHQNTGLPCFACNSEATRSSLTVIDVSGVHQVSVSYCRCDTRLPDHEQLLYSGLYPSTSMVPSTAFTLKGLEFFRFLNLQCKTTATGYYAFLRRITNPDNPEATEVSHPPNKVSNRAEGCELVPAAPWHNCRGLGQATNHTHRQTAHRRVPGWWVTPWHLSRGFTGDSI